MIITFLYGFLFSLFIFFFSSRRRHTRFDCDWSSDVCSSDLQGAAGPRRFGENLAAARALRGLSQKELASFCGLSQVQISYLEGGKRWPTLPQLVKLAEVLEIPFEELLTSRDHPGIDLGEIALELRSLGIVDLRIG